MAQNKEIRLFTAFVYTIAIIFIASYIVLSKQTPEEFKFYKNELDAVGLRNVKIKDLHHAKERKNKYLEAINALRNAETLTLFSLEPKANYFKRNPLLKELENGNFENLPYDAPPQYLYDILVLGQTELDEHDIEIATQAFREALGNSVTFCTNCYEPRHALRAQHNGHIYDFIICYTCTQVAIKKDGEFFQHYQGRPKSSPSLFNDLLKKHNVPLPYKFTEQAKKDKSEGSPP